jgi:hypothetical protein
MRIDIDNLRELFQGYALSRRPPDRKSCPSPKALASSFEPSASLREKKRIVDHLSECSFCREEFMMLFELQKSDPELIQIKDPATRYNSGTAARSDPEIGYRPFWRYACVLFGLALTISSIFLIVQQKDLSEAQRTREMGITLLNPEADQTLSSPLVFRWQGRAASEYYILELFDEALLPVWTSDKIRDVQLRLPPDVHSRFQPGKHYFWMVTAYSGDSKAEESKLARFMISN